MRDNEQPATGNYYTWQECSAGLNGETLRWMGKPGLENWDRLDPGVQLLIELGLPQSGERLLDLRCGTGLAGAVAAQRNAGVTLRDDSLVAVEAARRTLALHGLAGVEVAHGAADLPQAAFDRVWLNAPRGREWVRQLVAQAARALRPGGILCLVGPNSGGIRSYISDAMAAGWRVQDVYTKRRYRLAVCSLPSAGLPTPAVEYDVYDFICGDRLYRCAGAPGVFAWGKLDNGTRALIETMRVEKGERLLDLGCGCGIVGLAAALRGARVWCVDHSAAAIETTRRTLALNNITDVTVLPSDCAAAVYDLRFDVVATNPPFHQGVGVEYDVARQFICDAATVTRPGGRLYLVANRFIRYDTLISEWFRSVQVAYEDRCFWVIRATR